MAEFLAGMFAGVIEGGSRFDAFEEVVERVTALEVPSIRFRVEGRPTPKARPRFARAGKNVRTYTDAKTTAAEGSVAAAYIAAGGPRAVPKDKTRRYAVAALFVGAHGASDTDNLLKLVLDGLNKIAWPDDKQVDVGLILGARCPRKVTPYSDILIAAIGGGRLWTPPRTPPP